MAAEQREAGGGGGRAGRGGARRDRPEGLEPRHLGRAAHGEPAAQPVALARPVAVQRGQRTQRQGGEADATTPCASVQVSPRRPARPGPARTRLLSTAAAEQAEIGGGGLVEQQSLLAHGLLVAARVGVQMGAHGRGGDDRPESRRQIAQENDGVGELGDPGFLVRGQGLRRLREQGRDCRPSSVDRACSLPSAASVHSLAQPRPNAVIDRTGART